MLPVAKTWAKCGKGTMMVCSVNLLNIPSALLPEAAKEIPRGELGLIPAALTRVCMQLTWLKSESAE